MNGTMRHEILRNVRCSRSLVIPTSLEKSEHTRWSGWSALHSYSAADMPPEI